MQICLDLIPDETRRVFVAFSGGLDSCVLLHLLSRLEADFDLIPWHVNHGLQDTAESMELFCIEQAECYGLIPRIDHLNLGKLESNIEAEARKQRYQLFEQGLKSTDCIMTAHHANDQAETFLLNALRSSGVAGLRGIARSNDLGKATLLRPLLDYSRSQLEDYAHTAGLNWIEDPSNQDTRFDRNYLRLRIIPLFEARWENFARALKGSSDIQSETQVLLDDLAGIDLASVNPAQVHGAPAIEIEPLMHLSAQRVNNVIRFWISKNRHQVLPQSRLKELVKQLVSKNDAQPEIVMPEYSLRIYNRKLFLLPTTKVEKKFGNFDFGLEQKIEIEQHDLKTERADIFERLELEDSNQSLTLKYRDSCDGDDKRRLKRLFQKHRIPPWQRDQIAQIFLDGELKGLLI